MLFCTIKFNWASNIDIDSEHAFDAINWRWNIDKASVGKYCINRGCCAAVQSIAASAFENISTQQVFHYFI